MVERTRCVISHNIVIENPPMGIYQYCSEHLTVANPEYAKKKRMNFWLGDTPQTLQMYETHAGQVILPYGVLTDVLPLLDGAEFELDFRKHEPIPFKNTVPLFGYQEDAVSALMAKRTGGILQSPAGSGKTQIGIALAAKLALPTLWLTHTKVLLTQSKARAEQYLGKEWTGTITEGKVDIGKGITFATVQTMASLDLPLYRHKWGLIIVDECHLVSGTPTALTRFYRVLNNLAASRKVGLSATVHRSDGLIKATYSLIGGVVHTVSDEEVGSQITKAEIQPVETGVKIDPVCLNTDGTLHYTKLIGYLAGHEERNALIVKTLEANRGKSSLILSSRLQHLRDLMEALPWDMQLDAVMIDGSMVSKKQKAAREQALEDMRTGRKKYLFASYQLAKEGLDIPRLERLYMATPQKDYAVIVQSVGRIERRFEDKEAPVCIDFVDDIAYLVKAYKKRCTTYRKKGNVIRDSL